MEWFYKNYVVEYLPTIFTGIGTVLLYIIIGVVAGFLVAEVLIRCRRPFLAIGKKLVRKYEWLFALAFIGIVCFMAIDPLVHGRIVAFGTLLFAIGGPGVIVGWGLTALLRRSTEREMIPVMFGWAITLIYWGLLFGAEPTAETVSGMLEHRFAEVASVWHAWQESPAWLSESGLYLAMATAVYGLILLLPVIMIYAVRHQRLHGRILLFKNRHKTWGEILDENDRANGEA